MLPVKKESSCFLAHTLPALINAVIHKHRVTHAFSLPENMVPAVVYLILLHGSDNTACGLRRRKLKKLQLYTGEESRGSRALRLDDPTVTDSHEEH